MSTTAKDMRKLFEDARKDDIILEELIAAFCKNFLKDRLDRPLILRPHQMGMIKAALSKQRVVILAPRGSGKSYSVAVAVSIRAFFLREKEHIVVISPSNKQSKTIMDYVLTLMTGHPELKRLIKTVRNASPAKITFYGNSFLTALAVSKNDHGENVRGIHPTYCIVDESGFIPDEIFIPNVEPIVVANNAPFINITTPGPKENHVYKYLYDDKFFKRWHRIIMNYKSVTEQGDAYEPTYPVDPITGKSEVEQKLEEWGEDSPFFRREYLCLFDSDESNIFSDGLFSKTFYPLHDFHGPERSNFSVLTIDYGRKHNSTAWAAWEIRQDEQTDFNVAYLVDLMEIKPVGSGLSPQLLKDAILSYIDTYNINIVVIDATSFGDTFAKELEEYLYSKRPGIILYPFIFSVNKSQWYFKYKYMMNELRVRIPSPSRLCTSINGLLMTRAVEQHKILTAQISDRSNNILVTKPRNERDDLADCMMLITYFLSENPRGSRDLKIRGSKNSTRNTPWMDDSVRKTRVGRRFGNFKKSRL